MDVTPLLKPEQKLVQSYTAGRFRISGEVFDGAVIVGADFVVRWQAAGIPDDPAEFLPFMEKCDVLLIGTGQNSSFLSPAQRQRFRDAGFNVDVMDTGAACRTFNVLSAEGRRVVAALLPV